jgi:hypothetical protein
MLNSTQPLHQPQKIKKTAELTFITFDSVALDSEPAFLNEDGLESSGSESSSPSINKSKKDKVHATPLLWFVTREKNSR